MATSRKPGKCSLKTLTSASPRIPSMRTSGALCSLYCIHAEDRDRVHAPLGPEPVCHFPQVLIGRGKAGFLYQRFRITSPMTTTGIPRAAGNL